MRLLSIVWFFYVVFARVTVCVLYFFRRMPEILIVHLKRFNNDRWSREKNSAVVDFPLLNLDMSPWVVNEDEKKNSQYDLYAVSQHYGGYVFVMLQFNSKKHWLKFTAFRNSRHNTRVRILKIHAKLS